MSSRALRGEEDNCSSKVVESESSQSLILFWRQSDSSISASESKGKERVRRMHLLGVVITDGCSILARRCICHRRRTSSRGGRTTASMSMRFRFLQTLTTGAEQIFDTDDLLGERRLATTSSSSRSLSASTYGNSMGERMKVPHALLPFIVLSSRGSSSSRRCPSMDKEAVSLLGELFAMRCMTDRTGDIFSLSSSIRRLPGDALHGVFSNLAGNLRGVDGGTEGNGNVEAGERSKSEWNDSGVAEGFWGRGGVSARF